MLFKRKIVIAGKNRVITCGTSIWKILRYALRYSFRSLLMAPLDLEDRFEHSAQHGKWSEDIRAATTKLGLKVVRCI